MAKDTQTKTHKIHPYNPGVSMCFNTYCVHENNLHCQLPAITLNDQGVCSQCRMVMPENYDPDLQCRKDQLKKLKPGIFF